MTRDLRESPEGTSKPLGIEATDPDVFLVNRQDLNLHAVIVAFRTMRERSVDPRQGPEEVARPIERNGLPITTVRLRTALPEGRP